MLLQSTVWVPYWLDLKPISKSVIDARYRISGQFVNTKECSSTDLICEELIELVQAYSTRLSVLDEPTVVHKPSPKRWSIKQVLGHLIDSACNNHQRFIRAQNGEQLKFADYDQNHWVASQNYDECSWAQLIELWRLYNLHLAHVIRQIPDNKMRIKCTITPNEPVSLSFLVEDYLEHMKHHLNKISERVSL